MNNRNNSSSLGLILILILVVGGGVFVYFSSMFERVAPEINVENNGYWNLKKPLKVKITDASGIIEYKVTLKSKDKSIDLQYERLMSPKNSILLEVEPPRSAYSIKDKNIQIIVEAQDISKWNYFKGNRAVKNINLLIDKKRPQLSIVSNSYKISRGGSALVIFKVNDENLDKLYIE